MTTITIGDITISHPNKARTLFLLKEEACNLEGNFIKEFNSISEASKKTNTNRTSLSQCLNGKLKSANKFIWKRKNN